MQRILTDNIVTNGPIGIWIWVLRRWLSCFCGWKVSASIFGSLSCVCTSGTSLSSCGGSSIVLAIWPILPIFIWATISSGTLLNSRSLWRATICGRSPVGICRTAATRSSTTVLISLLLVIVLNHPRNFIFQTKYQKVIILFNLYFYYLLYKK